jgi:flagellar hook-associated protein 1 FlgK
MSGINQILNTAKDAFFASQISMEVTGANIANASTPGYVRQRAVLASTSPGGYAGNATQSGVEVVSVERLYDRFIEFQMVDQSSQVGDASVRKETFGRVEAIFNETDGGGLNDMLNQFWKASEDLSANPTGQVERTALANAADNLATMFRESAGQLYSIQTDLNTQIDASVGQLNGYLSDIADLNGKIVEGVSGGVNVNGLLDQRSELLKKTAGLIDIQYVEETGGAINVFTADGRALVQGNSSWQLGVRDNGKGFYDVVYADNPTVPINDAIDGGKLSGMLGMRDATVAGYLTELDDLAGTLIGAVNAQHALGYDNYRNVGGNFFEPLGATGARDMQVAAAIQDDPNRIAAAATVNADGDNARAISRIKDSGLMSSGLSTLGDFYAALVGQIGQDVAEAGRTATHETIVMTQMTNALEQRSGVSTDEEMINLIKFQMGYSAAAKLASAADEMLKTLLNVT